MNPLEAMRQAELKGHLSFRKYREGLSPTTREKALKAALGAEEEFISARLSYWKAALNNNQAG